MEYSLAPFSFLGTLQREERHALEQIARQNNYKKRSYVFRADELNDSLFILLDGRIKITRLSDYGRELIQWFCLPGEIFGLSEKKRSRQRGLYAQTITSAKLLCIQKSDFDQYILEHPRVALLIIKQLASRLNSLGDMLLNVTSVDAHVRLIKLLQRLSEFYGHNSNDEVHIDIHITHQEMADMIGVCRQTVSSMIGRLKKLGIIEATRSGIIIQSLRGLQKLGEQPETFLNYCPQTPMHV